jgi:hypothetical protein
MDKVVALSNIGKVNVDVFAPGVKFMLQRQITLTNICKELSAAPNVAELLCNSVVLPNINGITRNTF